MRYFLFREFTYLSIYLSQVIKVNSGMWHLLRCLQVVEHGRLCLKVSGEMVSKVMQLLMITVSHQELAHQVCTDITTYNSNNSFLLALLF